MDSLITIVGFIVGLGVLVTFHEYGHFYVARRCGVKVLRFSIGFGKPFYSWSDKHGTDYTLSPIPLGGFVKMLDEREGDVPDDLLDQAFNRKSVWQRIAIVLAGPVANFILAIVLFAAMLLPGTKDVIPLIDKVAPNSLAAVAGLDEGQEVIAIDGVPTPTWTAFNRQLLKRLGETGVMSVVTRYPDSTLEYYYEFPITDWLKDADEPDVAEGLGIELYRPEFKAVVDKVLPDSPAYIAGIQSGDLVLRAGGSQIDDWMAWVDYVQARPNQEIEVEVQRANEQVRLILTPALVELDDGRSVGQVGLMPLRPSWPENMLRTREYTVLGAFAGGVEKTWDTSLFVLVSVKKLIVGQISTKNLSGPITIAKVAGASAKAGLAYYLGFIALLSVSLGVFNLLPIPVLDGGHLMYYFVEVVKGSPVSEKIQVMGYQIGLALVMGLMVLALYNDLMRL